MHQAGILGNVSRSAQKVEGNAESQPTKAAQVAPVDAPGARPTLQRMLPFALGLLLALVALAPALAQINFGENFTGGNGRTIPDGVNRFGEIEVTEVTSPIDGELLFKIASPTVLDRSQVAEGQHPVEQRAREIQARVELAAVERQMDSDSLRVEKATLNNVMVITARDDKHSRPLVLASVTNTDANTTAFPWRRWPKPGAKDWKRRFATSATGSGPKTWPAVCGASSASFL